METQYGLTYPGLARGHTVYNVAAEAGNAFSLAVRYGMSNEKDMLNSFNRIARKLEAKRLQRNHRATWKKRNKTRQYKGIYEGGAVPIAMYAAMVIHRHWMQDTIGNPLLEKKMMCNGVYVRGMKAKDQKVHPWVYNALSELDYKAREAKYKAQWYEYHAPKYATVEVYDEVPF